MKRLIPFALCLLLTVACARATKPQPPLPAAMQKQEAAIAAEIAQTREKLKKGKKISAPNEACMLYLYGALKDDRELLELLKKNGADINARNSLTGATALHVAVQEGNPESVRRLLKLGASPNGEDLRGCPPLYDAVGNDNTEVTRLLLDYKANPNAVEKQLGTTPLLCASVDGKVEIMTLLLKHGANPNQGYPRGGATPLHLAAMKGHAAAVQLLLKHGANPNARTQAGTTPLKAATDNNKLEVIEILKKHGAQ